MGTAWCPELGQGRLGGWGWGWGLVRPAACRAVQSFAEVSRVASGAKSCGPLAGRQ